MSRNNLNLPVNPEAVFREEDEGAFLFDPDTGRICYLNDLGCTIWKLLHRAVPRSNIVAHIAADYPDISRERIAEDCSRFLDHLAAFGFVLKE